MGGYAFSPLGVLGDCGRRFAELRGLRARDLRRPRSNERHHRLFVRGKGGGEREVPVALAVQQALEVWLKVHPLARGVGLLDEHSLFVRLGRHGHEQPLPLSAVGVHRLVRRSCAAAGLPARLAHPHALREYWATHCLEAGVPVHTVSARATSCRASRDRRDPRRARALIARGHRPLPARRRPDARHRHMRACAWTWSD